MFEGGVQDTSLEWYDAELAASEVLKEYESRRKIAGALLRVSSVPVKKKKVLADA